MTLIEINASPTPLNAERHNNWIVTSVNGRMIQHTNLMTGERTIQFSRNWLCHEEYEPLSLFEIIVNPVVLEQKSLRVEEGAEYIPYSFFKDGTPSGWKPVDNRDHIKMIAMGTEDGIAITPIGMAKYGLPPLLSLQQIGNKRIPKWVLTDKSLKAIEHLKPCPLLPKTEGQAIKQLETVKNELKKAGD